MIDSHCHLDASGFDADRSDVLSRARAAGVTALVVPAVGEATWEPILRLAVERDPRCHPALGVHPVALPDCDPVDDEALMDRLEEVVSHHRADLVAIGECGLDSTIDLERAPLERQERMLRRQLALARATDLPVILHARGPHTYERLHAVLKAEPMAPRGGVIHSYGGGVDFVKRFLDFPLFFGFAGPATWPNARKVRASIQAIPDDRLLAETDAPDQTPEPHRPGRNEPAHLGVIVEGIARAREDHPQRIARLTEENAKRLFRL